MGKTALVEGVAQRLLASAATRGRRAGRAGHGQRGGRHPAPGRLLREAPRDQGRGPAARAAGWWSSSTRSTRSSAPARPARGRRTPPTSSRRRWRAASSPASAPPRTTSTSATSSGTRPWSAASRRCWCASRACRRHGHHPAGPGRRATSATTASATRRRRSRPPPRSPPATSPTASCPTRRWRRSTWPARAPGARARPRWRRRDVARVVAKMAGIPESRLLATDQERVLGIESALRGRVVGHDDDRRPGGRGPEAELRRLRLAPAHGLVPVPGPDRRRQDRAGPRARRGALRHRATRWCSST